MTINKLSGNCGREIMTNKYVREMKKNGILELD
jgi:hypothetical protein